MTDSDKQIDDQLVDIVIVNWNSGGLLKDCIDSALEPSNKAHINKIFVIDNNSTDDSLKKLLTDTKLSIIQNRENLGFARAANQGFKRSSAPHVLLLNPDTRLLKDTLKKCIAFLKTRPNINILGCQMLNELSEVQLSCSRFPTPLRYFYDATGLSKMFPKIFKPAILMTDFDHKSDRYVDQVMGAFMFMRREIFDRVGFFDEQFFVYLEDLDFAKRNASLSGTSYFNADIQIYHKGKGTTENVKAYRLALNLRSRLLYGKKYFSRSGYQFLRFSTVIIEPFTRVVFLLLTGNFSEIKSVIRGYQLLHKNSKQRLR